MKKKTTTVKSRPVAKKPVTKYSPALLPKADRFNEGKEKWGLVHFGSLKPMVRVLEFGADKYSEDNWKKGLDKKEVLESSMRHLAAMIDGEMIDPESGLPHAGHIQSNMMFFNYHFHPEAQNGK